MSNLRAFYVSHERHAQLALRYPHATVVKNTMARYVVDAYDKLLLRGQQQQQRWAQCFKRFTSLVGIQRSALYL